MQFFSSNRSYEELKHLPLDEKIIINSNDFFNYDLFLGSYRSTMISNLNSFAKLYWIDNEYINYGKRENLNPCRYKSLTSNDPVKIADHYIREMVSQYVMVKTNKISFKILNIFFLNNEESHILKMINDEYIKYKSYFIRRVLKYEKRIPINRELSNRQKDRDLYYRNRDIIIQNKKLCKQQLHIQKLRQRNSELKNVIINVIENI